MSEIYYKKNPYNTVSIDQDPSFADSFKAAFGYQYSPIINRTQEELFFHDAERDPDFNPFDDMEGYEGYEDDLFRAKNVEHLEFIKKSIDDNQERRTILQESDFFSGALVAGLVDPLNIAFAIPVVGQLGLIARGGMTVGQAAAASARGGFAAATAAELVRAPFDEINTTGETAMNLLTTTAFSTVLGTAPSVTRNVLGSYHRSAAKLRDLTKGEMGDEIDGTSIIYNDSAESMVASNKKGITVNTKKIEDDFDIRPWKEEGLPDNAFNSPREYQDFLVNRENIKKTEKRTPGESAASYQDRINIEALDRTYSGYGLKETPFTNSIFFKMIPSPGKTILLDPEVPNWIKRDYVMMEGNGAMALERNIAGKGVQSIRQRSVVHGMKAKRAVEDLRAQHNLEVRQKEATAQIAGLDLNDPSRIFGYKGNFGKWFEETVDNYIKYTDPDLRKTMDLPETQLKSFDIIRAFYGNFLADAQDVGILRNVKNIDAHVASLREELKALQKDSPVEAVYDSSKSDVEIVVGNTESVRPRGEDGRYVPAFFRASENKIYLDEEYILAQFPDKPWTKSKLEGVKTYAPDEFESAEEWLDFVRTHEIYHTIYKAEDLGFDKTIPAERANYENAINEYAIKEIRAKREARKQAAERTVSDRELEISQEIAYYEGYKKYFANARSEYVFPIYYDKELLDSDPALRQELEEVFEKYISKETHYYNGEAWVKKPAEFDAAGRAKEIVANILEEDIDVSPKLGSKPKTKHLRHRAIDVPEHVVRKFIIKDERVMHSYAQRMGRQIEWTRNFGSDRIEDRLNKVEADLRSRGMSEPKIAKIRTAYLADYERVMGQHIRSPDRLDAKAARAVKETAGMTYLHAAGISSVVDAGMVVFERGLGKTLAPLFDKDVASLFSKAKKDIDKIVDGTGLVIPGIQQRVIGDSLNSINPNSVERFFNPITSAYYNIPILGNNLGSVTRYGKIVDATFRQSELIEMSVRVAKNDRKAGKDVEYLARYGIDIDTAKQIADLKDVWEVDPGGKFYYANTDNWPRETAADRDLLLKFMTALNSGTGNTIMHATSLDKPMIVDGVLYVRHYPWMENLPFGGIKADPRASTATIPMARLESGAMALPFQFMNFTLAATNRITGQIADPSRRHRLTGVAALLAMSYLGLQIKKPDWWFESKSNLELSMRIADHSGIFGIYADLFYMGLHGAIGMGAIDQDNEYLKGKYKPTKGDALFEPFGAGPGLVREWVLATDEALNGYTDQAKKRFYYNSPALPFLSLTGLNEDTKELWLK